jgi:hypothetical protein
MTTTSVDDFVQGGHPAIKFTRPGAKLVGDIVEARVGVERDYDTGQPAAWPDGTPKQQLVLDVRIDWTRTVDVTAGDDNADIGTIYCKFLQQRALAAACQTAGIKMSQAGPVTMIRLDDGVPRNPRYKPPQQYQATVAQRTAVDNRVDELTADDL